MTINRLNGRVAASGGHAVKCSPEAVWKRDCRSVVAACYNKQAIFLFSLILYHTTVPFYHILSVSPNESKSSSHYMRHSVYVFHLWVFKSNFSWKQQLAGALEEEGRLVRAESSSAWSCLHQLNPGYQTEQHETSIVMIYDSVESGLSVY